MRNVQDKKDAGVAGLIAVVGITLFAGIGLANAEPAPAPVTPVHSVNTVDTSGGVVTSDVSGGKLANK